MAEPKRLTLPIDEAQARELRVGDILYLTGQIFTPVMRPI